MPVQQPTQGQPTEPTRQIDVTTLDHLEAREADIGFELTLAVSAYVTEPRIESAGEELVGRRPDAEPTAGFEPIENLTQRRLIILDALQHVDHHRRPEGPIIGSDVAGQSEASGGDSRTCPHLKHGRHEVGRTEVDDPIAVVRGVVEQ
jgi:hypothetical protein